MGQLNRILSKGRFSYEGQGKEQSFDLQFVTLGVGQGTQSCPLKQKRVSGGGACTISMITEKKAKKLEFVEDELHYPLIENKCADQLNCTAVTVVFAYAKNSDFS